MTRIDFDHNATTRLDPRVREAILPFLDEVYGNPSSVHEQGRRARDGVERARAELAQLIHGPATGLIFTSGATEAIHLGVMGAARAARSAGRPARIVASPLEHPAVHGALAELGAEGFAVALVPVNHAGVIDLEALRQALGEGAALLVFALANHEIGNIHPVPALAEEAHRAGSWLFCDAAQAVGKIPVEVTVLGVDFLSLSAHKFHGPKGTGALWVRPGLDIAPLVGGGHQERGMRPGTENLPGIVGLGAAARLAGERLADMARVGALRDRLEAGLIALGARIHGDPTARVPGTTNVGFAGVPGELLVAALDLEGVLTSMGAACTSGRVKASPVISALGVGRVQAAEAVRFSLGLDNHDAEVSEVLELLPPILERIRATG